MEAPIIRIGARKMTESVEGNRPSSAINKGKILRASEPAVSSSFVCLIGTMHRISLVESIFTNLFGQFRASFYTVLRFYNLPRFS